MTPINAFLSFMERGGLVMWPLLFLSVVTVSIVLERGIFWLRLDSRRGRSRYRRLAEALRRGDRSRIAGLVDGDGSPYASLARDLIGSQDQIDEATAAVTIVESIKRPRSNLGLISSEKTAAVASSI